MSPRGDCGKIALPTLLLTAGRVQLVSKQLYLFIKAKFVAFSFLARRVGAGSGKKKTSTLKPGLRRGACPLVLRGWVADGRSPRKKGRHCPPIG